MPCMPKNDVMKNVGHPEDCDIAIRLTELMESCTQPPEQNESLSDRPNHHVNVLIS